MAEDIVEIALRRFEYAHSRAVQYENCAHPVYTKLDRLWSESHAARRALLDVIRGEHICLKCGQRQGGERDERHHF